MSEDLIESLWARADEGRPLDREEIAGALRPRLTRGTRTLRSYLWGYLGLLLVTLVLNGINIAAYWHHPLMRTVQLVLALLALGLALYGVRLLGDPGLVDRPSDPLLESVRRRLAFLGRRFEAWQWMAAVAVALLSFALNSVIDLEVGGFRINKPLVFVGINLASVAIVYGSLRLAFHPIVRELRATLQDLEDQLLERSVEVDRWKRRWRRWHVALLVLTTALLLLGVWIALQMMP